MKLVNREDFLKLESPVIFSKVWEEDGAVMLIGLYCKTSGTLFKNDWHEQDLIGEIKVCKANIPPYIPETDFELDLNLESREGLYEPSARMVVYDKEDIVKLINYLKKCVV